MARTLRLRILYQGGAELRNPYAVIVVNPQRHPNVNVAGARRFGAFLTEPATQRMIAAFGKRRFGQPLFHVYKTP